MTALAGIAQASVAGLPKNRTGPAFQVNAFQNDAFQINAGTSTGTGVLADGAATVAGVGLATNFSYLRGYSGGSTGAPLTTVNVANIALNAGEFAVCLVALDNIGTTDGICNEFNQSSVQNLAVQDSMGLGNPWLCAGEWRAGAGSLGGGQVISVWYCNVHLSMASSGSNFVTFTFNTRSGSFPASFAYSLGIFKPMAGSFGLLEQYGSTAGTGASGNAPGGEGLVNNNTTSIGSLDFASLNDMQLLRIRGIACSQGSAGTFSKTSTWDGVFLTGTGGPTNNAGSVINGEYSLGQVATTFPSAPSVSGVSGTPNWASYYVAFRASNFIMSANTDAHINNSGDGRWGTGTSTTASQTSVSASNSNNWKINVGDLAIAVVAQQATANNTDEGIVTSVTDSVGNTWTKAIEYSYSPSTWPNSACVSVWYCTVANQITGSSTVTAHFTSTNASSHNSSIIEVYGFIVGTVGGATPQLIATNKVGANATTAGSLDCATSTISALRFRAYASAEAGSVVAKTGNAWNSTLAAVANSGTNLNLTLRGEYGVSTGSSLASNPPASTAGAKSSVYLVFQSAVAPIVGTGALSDSSATVTGSGVTVSTGVGVLVDGASAVAGVGTAYDSASGVLVDGASIVAGLGAVLWAGTGALVDDVASVAGVGLSLSSGLGAIVDAASVVAGVGTITATVWTGTGALVDGASAVSGVAILSWSAFGALVDDASTVVGVGNVVATVWTGTGVLVDDASTAGGVGFVLSADGGGGALVDDAASVSGIAKISDFAIGAIADSQATVSGAGLAFFAGIGVLADGESVISGAGAGTSLGAGALVDALTVLSGVGAIVIPGAGVLVDGISTISGVGLVLSTDDQGSGSLSSAAVVLSDIGQVYWLATGVLIDSASVVVGSANIISTGRGIDNDTASFVVGVGFLSLLGTGALIDDAAIINGVGQIFADPPGGILSDNFATASGVGLSFSVGAGALVVGAAGLAGAGIVLVPLVGTGALVSLGSSIVGFGLSETIGVGALVDDSSFVYGLDSVLGTRAALVDDAAAVFGRGALLTVGSGNLHAGNGDVVGYVSRGFNPFYTVTQQVARGFEVAGAGRGFNVTQQTTRYPFTVTDQRKR